ncbi:MAG: 30S ribosomal protein S1 [Aggregatilineales bacterium]
MNANMTGSDRSEDLQMVSSGAAPSPLPADEIADGAAQANENNTGMDQPDVHDVDTSTAAATPAAAVPSANQSWSDDDERFGEGVDLTPEASAAATGQAAPTDPESSPDSAASDSAAASAAAPAVKTAEQTQTAEAAAESAESPAEVMAQAAAQVSRSGLKRGDIVDGTVIATSPTAVTVDIGGKAEGIIPSRELERTSRETTEALRMGAQIKVYVVNPNDHNGNVILSITRAEEELDWQRAEEYRQTQRVYDSYIAGYNRGGLIVRFGRLRGFVPQSQISPDRRQVADGATPEERWSSIVKEPIAVKVMEVDRSRNRLILSERAADRESRERRKERLISELAVGQTREGRVVSLVDFGAFVDIGGAEGLVHLTELTWQHITHPREVVRVGQQVKVEVISVDPVRKRIGLSMKKHEADPWDTVAGHYAIGQLVQGRITKLTRFGAFAQLVDTPEIEGLIHISELSEQRVNHPKEVVNEGDRLTLRVVKIDIPNRRLGLSLKRVNSAEYLDMDWNY